MEQLPPHHVEIGCSEANSDFPKNKQNTSVIQYFYLLLKVVWVEINTFYSLYFLILGILQALPGDLSTTEAWTTFVPLILVVGFSYLIQAIDFHKTAKSVTMNQLKFYNVIRDHAKISSKYTSIKVGDIFCIDDKSPVPCDCVLLQSEQFSVFVDTSTVDGETDAKDRYQVRLPEVLSETKLMQISGYIEATNPELDTRDVSGEIILNGLATEGAAKTQSDKTNGKGVDGNYEILEDGRVRTPFSVTNFIERGSVISSSGKNYFIALYTGKHCRSGGQNLNYVARRTLIDVYLEKLSVVVFCIQFIIAIILGVLGYKALRRNCPKGEINTTYIGDIDVYGYGEFFIALIIITRNFLLLSFMIPITLKIILPIFRFFYGLFIANDLNFTDPNNGACAQALSTNITENLGAIDVIVADKTGTLTKNSLELVSILVGNNKYGDNYSATIFEDDKFKTDLQKAKDDVHLYEMMRCLSICHSVRIDGEELFGSSADELAIIRALIKLGFKFTRSQDSHVVEAPFGTYQYKILRVLPFNRTKMTMSVVIQDETGVYVYTKGAPEKVVNQCTAYSGQEAALFDQFMKKGLRSLSLSFRKLESYSQEMSDVEIDENHFFLGSIGIEDALQQDVQITVDVLQQAGLKIWVATGDAHINTIVTTAMLKLINTKDQLLHLRDDVLRDNDELNNFATAAMQTPENSFTVLVNCESGDVVKSALQNEDFVDGLYRAKCVIFYRCKPQTKADVVAALQQTGRRVLAVGDGANDTQLLRSADVGIGMLSQDGKAGFTSCDFAIPSFRMLSRLILIHGHTSLHRSVLAVHFSFYKALQFGVCQAFYQFWTDFSGQSFFGSLSLLTFNVVWTFLPMIAILFEKDVSENFLYRLSYLYKKLRNPLKISLSNLNWMYLAIYQGLATMGVAYLLTGEAFLQTDTGKDLGRDFLSLIVFFAQVVTVTFYMVTQLNTLTYYSLILLVGNILLLIAFSGIFQTSWILDALGKGRDWQGFFGECFNSWPANLILVTIILASSTPAWLIMSIWNEVASTETLLVMEMETIAAKEDQPLFFDPPKNI